MAPVSGWEKLSLQDIKINMLEGNIRKYYQVHFVYLCNQILVEMMQNSKFERAAQQRKRWAIVATIALHLALFAAISYDNEWMGSLPDFILEMLGHTPEPAPQA